MKLVLLALKAQSLAGIPGASSTGRGCRHGAAVRN